MANSNQVDVAIVGAGIVGLAHALAAAKRGLSVVVFERNPYAVGASIRNFGMVWPIGQPAGALYERALKSREIWLDTAAKAGFAVDPCGSLHVVYRPDELAVLEEFVVTSNHPQSTVKLLTPAEVAEKSLAVRQDGLLAGLWSATETIVDPREAIGKIPGFLARDYDVTFQFGTVVTEIDDSKLTAGGKTWTAKQIFVCSGSDFETLYPDLYASTDITKVKLQMMRTAPQPNGYRIGTALCGGLTLTHYGSFAHCPSLNTLKARIETETPHFPQWGIHVMMSQNALGELIIGDSHEYSLNPEPFDRIDINQYILDYLDQFVQVPDRTISETWHGIYAKYPGRTELVMQPASNVTIVNALSGAGMTLSFGLAEEIVSAHFLAPVTQ
jgi:D-hydroxyproline dehydrogenase subunit beta